MAEFKRSPARILDVDMINTFPLVVKDSQSYLKINDEYIDRVNIMGTVVDISKEEITNNITLILDDSTGIVRVLVFDSNKIMNDVIERIKPGSFVMILGRIREFNHSKYIASEILREIDSRWIDYRKKQIDKIKDEMNFKEIKERLNERITKEEVSKMNEDAQDEEFEEESDTHRKDGLSDNPDFKRKDQRERNSNQQSFDLNDELTDEVIEEDVVDSEELSMNESIDSTNISQKSINKDKIIYDLINELDSGDGAEVSEVIEKSNFDDSEIVIKRLLQEGEIYEVRPGRLKTL